MRAILNCSVALLFAVILPFTSVAATFQATGTLTEEHPGTNGLLPFLQYTFKVRVSDDLWRLEMTNTYIHPDIGGEPPSVDIGTDGHNGFCRNWYRTSHNFNGMIWDVATARVPAGQSFTLWLWLALCCRQANAPTNFPMPELLTPVDAPRRTPDLAPYQKAISALPEARYSFTESPSFASTMDVVVPARIVIPRLKGTPDGDIPVKRVSLEVSKWGQTPTVGRYPIETEVRFFYYNQNGTAKDNPRPGFHWRITTETIGSLEDVDFVPPVRGTMLLNDMRRSVVERAGAPPSYLVTNGWPDVDSEYTSMQADITRRMRFHNAMVPPASKWVLPRSGFYLILIGAAFVGLCLMWVAKRT